MSALPLHAERPGLPARPPGAQARSLQAHHPASAPPEAPSLPPGPPPPSHPCPLHQTSLLSQHGWSFPKEAFRGLLASWSPSSQARVALCACSWRHLSPSAVTDVQSCDWLTAAHQAVSSESTEPTVTGPQRPAQGPAGNRDSGGGRGSGTGLPSPRRHSWTHAPIGPAAVPRGQGGGSPLHLGD